MLMGSNRVHLSFNDNYGVVFFNCGFGLGKNIAFVNRLSIFHFQ